MKQILTHCWTPKRGNTGRNSL